MVRVDYGNPVYVERALKTARLMRDLWMGTNRNGHFLMRSNFLGATGIVAGDALQIGSPSHENAIVQTVAGNTITLKSGLTGFHAAGEDVVRPSGGVKYYDAELTQDACASGRMLTFGKSSQPAVTDSTS